MNEFIGTKRIYKNKKGNSSVVFHYRPTDYQYYYSIL